MVHLPLLSERGARAASIYSTTVRGPTISPAVIRRVRSSVTAVIALSLGIALASWLKAGAEPGPAPPRGSLAKVSCCERGHLATSSQTTSRERSARGD